MSAKPKESNLDEIECKGSGASRMGKTYVKFRNGHLQLDVRGFLGSREGKASVAKVIRLSKGIPETKRDEGKEQAPDIRS